MNLVTGIPQLINNSFSFSLSWQISTADELGATTILFSKNRRVSAGTFSKSIVTTSHSSAI